MGGGAEEGRLGREGRACARRSLGRGLTGAAAMPSRPSTLRCGAVDAEGGLKKDGV